MLTPIALELDMDSLNTNFRLSDSREATSDPSSIFIPQYSSQQMQHFVGQHLCQNIHCFWATISIYAIRIY